MSQEREASDEAVTARPARRPVAVAEAPTVERYALQERIGEGAMGVVWRAYNRTLDRKVALKFLHDAYLGAIDQERLAEEARAMARLSHPNVVTVYDIGELDGRTFLTMEFVDGQPLSRWLSRPRAWREVVAVFRDICDGLAAAHDAGIVHRDVKPSNVLLGADGRARIADFGIARAGAPAGSPAGSGITGSPAYMSPQRFRGEPADASGDQYACCVAMYESLYGRRPFEAATPTESLRAMEAGPSPSDGSIPRWLHAVVAQGLAADPTRRFSSMGALSDALRGPRQRIWPLALAVGAGVAAVAVAIGMRGVSRAPCSDAPERLGMWSPLTAFELGGRFGVTGVDYAAATAQETTRVLDRYSKDWIAMHGAACRATHVDHVQSLAMLERRELCLDRRRHDLARAVEVLEGLDASSVERAPAIARGLEPIADCADPTYLDGIAAVAPSIEDDLVLARSLLFSGRYDEGRSIAQHVVDAATAGHDRAAECAALVLRGRMESLGRDAGAAIASLRAAAALATELRRPRLRAEALIFLSSALQGIGRLPEASEVLGTAETILATTQDRLLSAHAAAARGTLLGRQTRYEAAVPHFRRALDAFTEIYGLDSDALIPLLENLALALRRSGHAEEALRLVRRARELSSSLGDTHPIALKARRDLAIAIAQAGAPADAERELRALHETWRALRPDGDLAVAMSASDSRYCP